MGAIEWPYRPEGWETVICAMPAFPTLAATDVARSSAWYQEVLGFAEVFTLRGRNGVPMLAHLRWCVYGDVLLTPTRGAVDGVRGVGISLNFAAADVDAVAERGVRATVIERENARQLPENSVKQLPENSAKTNIEGDGLETWR